MLKSGETLRSTWSWRQSTWLILENHPCHFHHLVCASYSLSHVRRTGVQERSCIDVLKCFLYVHSMDGFWEWKQNLSGLFFFVLFLRNLGEFCLSSSAGLWLLPLHVMHSVLERSSSLEIVKVIRNSVYAFFRPITKVSLRVIVCVCLCHPGHWMISCAFVWGGCMWPRASSVGPVKHCLGGQESEVEDWILVLWCEPGGRKHAFWDRAALEDNWWNFCVSYIK